MDFAPQLEKAASRPPGDAQAYSEHVWLPGQSLAGVKLQPKEEIGGQDYIAAIVAGPAPAAGFSQTGTELVAARSSGPAARASAQFLSSKEPGLAREAVRTLRLRTDAPAQDLLRALAADTTADRLLRAEAVAGLAGSADTLATQRLLVTLLADDGLARDVLRSLREVNLPADLDEKH